jgi:hypothetical protein
MEQQAREQAFISALTTEQFVLQAARSANIGEMTGRPLVYPSYRRSKKGKRQGVADLEFLC